MARVTAGRRMVVRDAEDCLDFDGSGDYAEVVSSQMASISGEATICFWIKFAGIQSGDKAFLDCQWENDNAGGWQFYKMSGQNKWRGFAGDYSGRDVFMNLGQPFVPGRWYFVAVSKKASENRMTTYVDAVVVEARTNCTFGMERPANGYNLRIGGNRVGGAEASCSMRDVMIFDKELSLQEMQDMYYSDMIPASLVHHWIKDKSSDSVATDSKGSANASITGATWSLLGPMKLRSSASNRMSIQNFDGSITLNGSSDSLSIANTPSLRLTNAFSISVWVYNKSYGGNEFGRIIDMGFGSQYGLYICGNSSPRHAVVLQIGSSNYNINDLFLGRLGKWNHIVATFDKNLSSNQIKIYLNGSILSQHTRTTDAPTSLSNALIVGNVNNFSRFFDGYISQLRIWNGYALSQSEVEYLSFAGKKPSAGDAYLVLELLFENGLLGKDTSGAENNGSPSAGAVYSSFVPMKARVSV